MSGEMLGRGNDKNGDDSESDSASSDSVSPEPMQMLLESERSGFEFDRLALRALGVEHVYERWVGLIWR